MRRWRQCWKSVQSSKYPTVQVNSSGTFENVGDCLASGNAGLSNQLEEVISPSLPTGGVLGVRSRHLSVDDIPTSGKNQQNLAVVRRSGTEKTVLTAVPIIFDRKVTKCLYSHSARSPSFSPYANDEYKGPGEIFSQLRGLCRPPRGCPGGTEMVVTQPKTLERESFVNPNPELDVVNTTDASKMG